MLHQQLQVAIIDVNYSPQLADRVAGLTRMDDERDHPYTGSAWASMPSGPVSASSSAGLKGLPNPILPHTHPQGSPWLTDKMRFVIPA